MTMLLLLLSLLPAPGVACECVDLVEVNHVYDLQGKPVLVQAVFYDWRPQQSDYHVKAWRLLKSDDQRPTRDFQRGGWVMLLRDGDTLREVRAVSYCESWTQYDVERVERDRLPQERRAGLLFERSPPVWVE